jgi:hypothetical protein
MLLSKAFYERTGLKPAPTILLKWNHLTVGYGSMAQAENDRAAAVQRRAEERELAARRARIQNRWIVLQIRHQLAPSEQTRAALTDFSSFLQES